MKLTQAEIDAMPMEEKLELSEALWESMHAQAETLPMPEWHKSELDKRLAEKDPQFDAWENVKKRIQKQ